jgi:hypothetical protein
MRPETRLYQLVKKHFSNIIWTRLENTVVAGVPDLLGYNKKGYFFTLELKVAERERIRFSPHQIAFHKLHPKNSFILVQSLDPRSVKLYEGSRIMDLVACGLKLDACGFGDSPKNFRCLGLEACRLRLEAVGPLSNAEALSLA